MLTNVVFNQGFKTYTFNLKVCQHVKDRLKEHKGHKELSPTSDGFYIWDEVCGKRLDPKHKNEFKLEWEQYVNSSDIVHSNQISCYNLCFCVFADLIYTIFASLLLMRLIFGPTEAVKEDCEINVSH